MAVTLDRDPANIPVMGVTLGSTAVVVRPARADDLDDLLRLYDDLAEDRQASRPAPRDVATARLRAINEQLGRVLLVAELGARVVGTADLLIVPNLTHGGDPWAVVENVVVDPAARRQGVGRALLEEVIRLCDQTGCYKIQLLSRKHRHEAHAFYRRIGFEVVADGFRRYATGPCLHEGSPRE